MPLRLHSLRRSNTVFTNRFEGLLDCTANFLFLICLGFEQTLNGVVVNLLSYQAERVSATRTHTLFMIL